MWNCRPLTSALTALVIAINANCAASAPPTRAAPAGAPFIQYAEPSLSEPGAGLSPASALAPATIDGPAPAGVGAFLMGLSEVNRVLIPRFSRDQLPRVNRELQFLTDVAVERQQRIHVLIIGWPRDGAIGRGVEAGRRRLIEAFGTAFPPSAGNLVNVMTVGWSQPLSVVNIDRSINSIQVRESEILFVYVMTHGAYNDAMVIRDPTSGRPDVRSSRNHAVRYGHYFAMEQQTAGQPNSAILPRSALAAAALGKAARLTVILSDSCNERTEFPAQFPQAPTSLNAAAVGNNLRSLLLNYRGVVDINSSEIDQFSWYYNEDYRDNRDFSGGLFSMSFCTLAMGTGHDDWSSFFRKVQQDTNLIALQAGKRPFPMLMTPLSVSRVSTPVELPPDVPSSPLTAPEPEAPQVKPESRPARESTPPPADPDQID